MNRRLALAAVGAVALLGAGCMTRPIRPVNADGTWCYRTGNRRRKTQTCTPGPVPNALVEADAKRFESRADRLTVYVVRKRWGDPVNLVQLTDDDALSVATAPESFVRMRLAPGSHRLRATWSEGSAFVELTGDAGDIRFIELIGSVWAWGSTYRLEPGDPDQARERVRSVRMVGDLG